MQTRPRSHLFSLPCGCVIDVDFPIAHWMHGGIDMDVMECPWCEATFETDVVLRWLAENADAYLHVGRTGRKLFRVGNDIVEHVGQCDDCGCLLVAKCGAKKRTASVSGDVWHLDVPPSMIKVLDN